MQHNRTLRVITAFLLLTAGIILFLILNVCIGTVSIPFKDILSSIRGQEVLNARILWDIRMPRTLAALILGGALALAGYLLQTFFHNPIAGPFVLGISSGAKMMVALFMVFFMGRSIRVTSFTMILAAFLGAMICMGFVLLMARRVNRMSMLVVSGVMIGYICSAITEFVVTFAEDAEIVNLHNWSRGSFSGMNWNQVRVMSVVVFIACICIFLLAKPLSAYQMGEGYAQSMGIHIRFFRVCIILLSSLLSACVTALAGPISFVGIAVPHITRLSLKTTKPVVTIPAIFLCGAVFCMFCDLIARTIFSPSELAIGTVTAVFGAPVVIWLMVKRQK